MDMNRLYCTKHWLQYSSFCLNNEYYVILRNTLLVLQNENHFKKVFFWGVIRGVEVDYYIVFGYQKDAILDRKYFYSDDCRQWKLLPIPQKDHLILTELCKRPFQGDPGMVLEIVDDAPKEELFPDEGEPEPEEGTIGEENKEQIDEESEKKIEDNEDQKAGGEPQNTKSLDKKSSTELHITSGELKEEDRLAAVVHIISEETSIVPRGGLFKQTDGVNIHSRAFEGLSLEEVDELRSFQHYRQPREEWNTNLLSRVDYNYAIDYLDTIDRDIPSDCWSGQLMDGERVIILRNLTWPGFTFFHHIQNPDHGFIYVGSGQRNLDVPFMTQVSSTAQNDQDKVKTVTAQNDQNELKTVGEKESSRKNLQGGVEETNVKGQNVDDDVTSDIITTA